MSTITTELLGSNKEIMDRFLVDREIEERFRLPAGEVKYGNVYCIENLKSGKKYIGSTFSVWTGVKNPSPCSQIRKRASQYLYEYNAALKQSPSIWETLRPIIRAMVKEGIENFIMYPIAETTAANHELAENYFIEAYNSIEDGYNVQRLYNGGNPYVRMRRVQSRADKIARSEPILAINLNRKELVLVDSMKLFADYLGTTKDIIKNQARSGRCYKGWFIFYIREDKRAEILNNYIIPDNLGIQKNGHSRNHSEKYKKFYVELYDAVNKYLKQPILSGRFEDFTLLDPIEYE